LYLPSKNSITAQFPQARSSGFSWLRRDWRRIAIRVWSSIRYPRWRPAAALFQFWYVLRLEARSFASRIQAQLSKIRDTFVDFGPAFEPGDTGYWILHRRTRARVLGIQELETLCPWANSGLDIQVFLRGFDAGERYARREAGIEPQEPDTLALFVDPFVSPNAYPRRSRDSAQISFAIPAAVAGVTRKGE